MKRIISCLLVVIIILGALTSCDIKYDESEVKVSARELIEKSIVLNEIYFGNGIPYVEDKNTSEGVYYRALDSYHYLIGFNTIEELKSLTEETFSKAYSAQIYSTVLTTIQDGDKAIILSRYYQKYNSLDLTKPEYIMVNSTYNQLFSGDVTYDYDSIKVIGSDDKAVYVTLNATVTLDSLEPQTTEIKISLVDDGDGWRIDNPTFLNYNKTNLNNK